MSKSRGNVVNPDEYVRRYGADVMRAHMLFIGNYSEGGDFRDSAITGIVRFYKRAWEWVTQGAAADGTPGDEARARRAVHKAIKKVGEDLPALSFNTAIAALMETLNVLRECRLSPAVRHELARAYVLLLAPIAPFLAEELWERLSGPFSVHQQRWPAYDRELLVDETIVVPVQINGKLRSRIEVAATASEAEITDQALRSPGVQRYTADKQIVKTIYLPGRLLNIVTK
jgi:leucyl-tRNA synthetase